MDLNECIYIKKKIINIIPKDKNIDIIFIVLELKTKSRTNSRGKCEELWTFKIADETGSIFLNVYGDEAKHVQPSDILRLTEGISFEVNNCIFISNKFGEIEKIGSFCMSYVES